jgi:hypothetical protein
MLGGLIRMDTLLQSLPFVAAIGLLVGGVVRLRRFLFVASFPVLFGACVFALAADGTSAAFNFMGGFLLLFGLAYLVLRRRLQPGTFVSRDGLGAIGVLLFFIGLFGLMIL